MKFQFISRHSAEFRIKTMCEVLEVSSSGYYAWLRRPRCRRRREDRRLRTKIRAIHQQSRSTYGSPRIQMELRESGDRCSRKRVARLMREEGLQARQRRRFKATTDSKHRHAVVANRLNRQFDVSSPNQTWLGDITYLRTGEGWLYLAALLDLGSRRIVGWSMSDRINQELTLSALDMAVSQRRPQAGLLHHSDRGSQYACPAYQKALRRHGMTPSMSRRGDCYDNAPMESFFHTLKVELIHGQDFATRAEVRSAVFRYLEGFYNPRRRHSSLGYLSPVQWEKEHVKTTFCG